MDPTDTNLHLVAPAAPTHPPRTLYATRVTRTPAGEAWDLWSVEDGRRVGFLTVLDDGHAVYALAAVTRGTSQEEIADLVEGLFTSSATDAAVREIIVSEYDDAPAIFAVEPGSNARAAGSGDRAAVRTPGAA